MGRVHSKTAVLEIFIVLALGIPFLGSQWVVGSLVNAMFLAAVFMKGLRRSLPLALLPSLVACMVGIMPALLFLPFIWASNVLLMAFFDKYRNNLLKAVLIAVFAKTCFFIVLGMAFSTVGALLWVMQFSTALIGGLIFLKINDIFDLSLKNDLL